MFEFILNYLICEPILTYDRVFTKENSSPARNQNSPAMEPSHLISYFFGGAFLVNFIPHFVAGVMGRPFQSPFAKPPGEGLSSSTVNVLWGGFNLAVSYLLLVRVGSFDLHDLRCVLPTGAGMLILGTLMAHRFGRFNGGNVPERS